MMGNDGNQDDLPARIALEAGVSRQLVLTTFQQHGLPLASAAALPRPLRVSRLRIAGDRTVTPKGSFDTNLDLGNSLTVLVANNLKGKTSVLELITWCLRGTHREDLQGVVKSWIRELDCDALVAGRPLGFRLTMDHGKILDARILSAPTLEALRDVRVARADLGVTEVVAVQDEAAYGDATAALMLDLMNLGRLENAQATAASGRAAHGWPVYFGAIYLPAGGDRALLGDVVMGGLAGRLLQVFLDLPSAALLTQVRAIRDARAAASKAEHADVARLRALQAQQYEQTRLELSAAKERLLALTDPSEGADSVGSLAAAVVKLGRELVDAESALRHTQQAYDILRAQRQSDEKTLNDLRESAVARALFHALDPVACPRCEAPVTSARKAAERDAHTCSMCASPVAVEESSREHVEQEARDRVKASREAEQVAKDQLVAASAAARSVRGKVADVEQRLQMAERATQTGERAGLTATIARLEGILSVLTPPDGTQGGGLDDIQRVLNAAVSVLEADGVQASQGLFDALNTEIVKAAQRFGMRDLERVKIDRGARLQVYKSGGPREWFSRQSPGERLRLRIAVVVALLRVGTQFGLATHPGLLLIDSPKAEEVQDIDATALLTELESLTTEIPGLQAILTLVDEPLARDILTKSKVIAPAGPGGPMW
ncbi:ATP-binding protein [Micromonospora sp. NPDC047793]|uniref:ATP-binding protein n=1 Tax=Micromonospora sp. NPDC047793 TaxID=3154342 RepID=UPI0033E30248